MNGEKMTDISDLLTRYHHLVDFEDKMQKSNYKFVEGYIGWQKRKNRKDWQYDCLEFLNGAIRVQIELLENIRRNKVIFR